MYVISHIFLHISNVSCFSFLLVYVLLLHSILSVLFPSIFSPFVCVCLSVFLYQGGCIHDGTWQSAVYGFADSQKLQSIRRKFNHKPLPIVGSKLKRRYVE